MAVGYRGRAQKSTATGVLSFASGDFDVTLASGDLLVACVSAVDPSGVEATVGGPAGWTNRVGWFAIGSNIVALDILTKDYSVSDTTYVFTDGSEHSTSPDLLVTILVFNGHNSSSPISGTGVFADSTTATSQVIPSLTTLHANTMLVAAAAMSGTTIAYSSTGVMTERATVSESTSPARLVAATQEVASAGATGTRTFTAGAAGVVYVVVMFAIREQPTDSALRAIANISPSMAVHRSTRW